MEQQILELVKYGGALGGVVVVLFMVERILKVVGIRRGSNGHLRSGELAPEVWDARIASIVNASFVTHVLPILVELKELQRELVKAQGETHTSVELLIDRIPRDIGRAAGA